MISSDDGSLLLQFTIIIVTTFLNGIKSTLSL